MLYQFPIRNIRSNPTLRKKFSNIGKDEYIQRIFAEFVYVKPDGENSITLKGIIDTGATFTLLPISIIKDFNNLITEDHTLWGIIDSPECHIKAKISSIPIRFIDHQKKISPEIDITVAFSYNENLPILIGMKDILGKFNSKINITEKIFQLEI